MSQTLYLPLDEVTLNVGYKSETYAKQYLCTQYGTDLAAPARMVHASARGVIEKIGTDTDGTVFAVVRYEDVTCRDGEARTIYAKYGHLRRCQLDEGQDLEDGELLGSFEGGYLHVELATEYDPERKPVFNSSARAYDGTIAPYLVWQAREKSDPDNGLYAQTIQTKKEWIAAGWVSPWDILDFSAGEPPVDEPGPEPEPEPDPQPDTPEDTPWELKYKALVYDLRALVKKYEGE
jgi:murein DD-endopeptidase MepM/ murein hydrolase activator NlpD